MSKHDKTRPSGLLESWFGRPKGKQRGNGISGSGKITADGEPIDIQELELDIKRLTEDEVDHKLMEILEDMNIPKDKRLPLFKKPVTEKRDMIFIHLKGKNSLESRSNSRFEKPYDYIEYLQTGEHSDHKIYQCVENLRVSLTSNPISWIKEFGEEGINEVLNLLRRSKKDRNYEKIEVECIRCLKAACNNTWGLNLILKPDQHAAVLLLAQSLEPHKPQVMCEALRLLAGFCLVPGRNCYEKVLRAITSSASSKYKAGERFKSIVEGLFVEKGNDKKDLCCQSLIFINTIVNTPTDLNFRLHLRCEFMRMGLFEKLDLLTNIVEKSNNESLKHHYKIFNETREEDFEEFIQRFDNVRFELDDISDCFEVLKNLVVDTDSEPYFLSILQHLLYIRDDHVYRPAYYQLIEECISQIVFHKGFCDPNFDSRDFHIDTSLLLDDIAEKSKAKEIKRTEEYEKKIEALEIAKQEAEARAAHLEERLRQFEAGGVVPLSSAVKGSIPPPPPMPGAPRPPPPPPMPGGAIPPPPPPMPGGGPAPPPPPPMPGMGPPRPPPFPGMGGIRPPPPFPGMGGPPPPPGLGMFAPQNTLPPGVKPKKKWEVKNPMKRANWKAILPHKMSEKAFWLKCQEDKLASEDLLSELSTRFSSKPVKRDTKDSSEKPMGTLKKNVVDLRVLDSKSAQNLLILLNGSLKHLSYEQIKLCILRCDTDLISSNILQQLIQYLPPPDQLKRLQEIRAKGDELSGVEQFAATIGEIKRLGPRLHSLNFKLSLADMINDIKPDIVAGTAACEEVKHSKKFARILELILLMGNYMNSGSKNEQAFGFEFSFLTKLTNTKDYENKLTLLHYIVDVVEKKFPEALNFFDDLSHIDKASRVSLETIQKTMKQIINSMSNLQSDLNNNKVPQCPDDRFLEVMGKFAADCKQQIDVLDKMQNHMIKLYKDLSEYYCFDPMKYTMEECFSDIKSFKDSFVQAHQDNVRQREEEEKAIRLREAREQSQRDLIERQQRKLALVDIDAAQTQEGVMDSLLEALQTGSAFGNRDNRQKRKPRPAGAERRAQLNRSRSRTRMNSGGLTTREMLVNELLSSA